MHLSEFQELALRTAKPLEGMENLRHVAYGVAGEAGEFCDCIKKADIYSQELDRKNALEELGDLLWYIALGADALDTDLPTIAHQVIEKLRRRYPEKYEDALAQARMDKRKTIGIDYITEKEWDQLGGFENSPIDLRPL